MDQGDWGHLRDVSTEVVSLSPTAAGPGLLPSQQCGVNETGITPRSGVTAPRFALCAGSSAQWLVRACGALSGMACLPPHVWTVPTNGTVRQNPQGRPRLYGGGGGRDLQVGRRPPGQLLAVLPLEAGVGPGRARHVWATHPGPLRGGQADCPLRERFQRAWAHA